jgi:TfoX/Sxy family transcriptional regulator of competence genes
MPYSQALAQRIRSEIEGLPGLVEKKMFGGTSFMLNGNMACGVIRDELIVRVGVERYDEALTNPQARPFAMTGKPMAGWVVISPDGLEDPQEFREWIRWGVDCASNLPPKSK